VLVLVLSRRQHLDHLGGLIGDEALHLVAVDGNGHRFSLRFVQPVSADDVAAALAELAANSPVNGIVELAGFEEFRLDELVRRVLSAKNDARLVRADIEARYFGAELNYFSLTPGGNARIAPTLFEEWLSQPRAGQNLATERRVS
jgi:uncharacterized protein YbjT (DUF2867 family)